MSERICTGWARRHLPAALLSAGLILSLPAEAAPASPPSGENAATAQGATLTLRMLEPDAEGRVRGALEIALEPGWKTYWIAPGPVGLPPSIDGSASLDLDAPTVRFPVPERFSEGGETSVGYTRSTAVALEAKAKGPAPELRFDVLIGLCRDLCVPFSAELAARPSSGLSDRAAVRAAFADLPQDSADDAGWSARFDAKRMTLHVETPTQAKETQLFLAPSDGWTLGEPLPSEAAGPAAFEVPVLRIAPGAPSLVVDALAVSEGAAVRHPRLPVPTAP